MTKRIISVVIAGALAVCGLCGCGNEASNNTQAAAQTPIANIINSQENPP